MSLDAVTLECFNKKLNTELWESASLGIVKNLFVSSKEKHHVCQTVKCAEETVPEHTLLMHRQIWQ